MAGTAKTGAFLLSSATVMLGAQDQLFNLNPDEHSIGLVKNFQVSAEPGFVELTQGVENQVVYTQMNKLDVKCSMEVYEYTMRNLAYGSGLDGSGVAYDAVDAVYPVKTDVDAADTTVDLTSASDVSSQFPVGSWIYLQNGTDDKVHVARVTAVAYVSTTVSITFADHPVPTGMSFPAAVSTVGAIRRVDVGRHATPIHLAAKVVGILPKESRPVVLLFPKVRITKGVNLAFSTDNVGNLPFEFTPYALLPDDPNYEEFGSSTPFTIFGNM